MTLIQDDITAYHEAAHAVIAILLRKPFDHITVIPNGSSLGSLHLGYINYEALQSRNCARNLMILFAGLLMEVRCGRTTHKNGSGQDLLMVEDIINIVKINDDLVCKCIYSTQELLTAYEKTIIAVKQELFVLKTIPFSRVRAIVKANTSIPPYEASRMLLSIVGNERSSFDDFTRSRRITWAGDWPYFYAN